MGGPLQLGAEVWVGDADEFPGTLSLRLAEESGDTVLGDHVVGKGARYGNSGTFFVLGRRSWRLRLREPWR